VARQSSGDIEADLTHLVTQMLIGRETELAARPCMVHAAADSPERFEIVLEGTREHHATPL
jgi:hypothetical protein